MAEITVKVEKRVLGWKLGQVITLEHTRLIDNLIKNNALTVVEYPSVEQIENQERPNMDALVPGSSSGGLNFGEGTGDAEQGAGDGDDQSAEDLDGPTAEGEGPR